MATFNKKELSKEEKKQYKEMIYNFSYLVNNFNNLEEKYLKEKIKGLSIIEIHLIDTIYKNPLKTTTEIAAMQNVTVGALMTCLKKLYEKGYVERIDDVKDKRIVHLKTTDLAKPVVKLHDEVHNKFIDAVIEETDFDNLSMVMQSMINELNKLKSN